MMIKRRHLFEFEDFAWFPASLRNWMTDFLRQSTQSMRLHKPIVDLLMGALRDMGQNRIVDLCSGGGGLLVAVQREIASRHGQSVAVTLTDKYPNIPAFEALCAVDRDAIEFAREPVDATDVPAHLHGLRTLFSAFHHFRPETAREILKDAHDSDQGIAIIEISQRSLVGLIPMILAPIGVWLFTPAIRPFEWRRLVFTYLIPAVPFFIMWDGIVSALRTYSVGEMRAMTETLGGRGYVWRIGRLSAPFGYKITYLLGVPDPNRQAIRDR